MAGLRQVGGVFPLPDRLYIDSRSRLGILDRPHVACANARSALYLLSSFLRARRVWLPSFLCEAIASAFDAAATQFCFYPVSASLAVDQRSWVHDVRPGDLVLLIDYFGFPCEGAIMTEVRAKGGIIVEDASQALLSTMKSQPDYLVYSPRKFLGIPDGGLLVSWNGAPLPAAPSILPPTNWWLEAFSAVLGRRESANGVDNRNWLRQFQKSEASAPCGSYAMSELSRALIEHSFDYADIRTKRRRNYRKLAERLAHLAILPCLPRGVVPLGFPIRLRNREAVRQALFNEGIFPPIHWTIAGLVPREFRDSHSLSDEILTLVCDQRYGSAEMDRTADIVSESAAESR